MNEHTAQPAPHIAVVGGGIAGLVAARDLAHGGARVSLFESESVLGGRIRSAELAGVPIDVGAEAFATRGGTVAEFLAELGLADRIVSPAPLGSWVVAGERALPLPPGGAIGIPVAPLSATARQHLGLWGSVRAAIEPWKKRRPVTQETTVAELIGSRLGPRVLDRLVRPVTLGVYSADPERLKLSAVPGLAAAYNRTGSLVAAARELRASSTAAGGAVAALEGGMTPLIVALEAELRELGAQIHTGAEVAGIERGEIVGDNGASLARVDGVVLAVAEPVAHHLLGLEGQAPANAEVEVIALVVNDARLDAAPRGTGVLVANTGDGDILAKALTHATAKWPDRAAQRPAGQHVIRVSYGRSGSAPETAQLGDDDAFERARHDASRILGVSIAPESVADRARQRWEMGAPPSAEPRIVPPPGVALAGDWVHGSGLASVIPGARRAAAELLVELRTDTSSGTPENHTKTATNDESEVRPA